MIDVPAIETDRMILRAPGLDALDGLAEYYADPRSKWNGGPRDRAEAGRTIFTAAGQWALRGHGIWFAWLRDTGTYAGFCGIFHAVDWPEPELGYGFTAACEGKGLAFEATAAARAACASLGLTRLPSYIHPANTRSQALARRLGATHEADITLRGEPIQVYRHPEVTP